jgi:hypothetical protein
MSDELQRILSGSDPPPHSPVAAFGVGVVLICIFVGAALFLRPVEAVLIGTLAVLLFGKWLIPRP